MVFLLMKGGVCVHVCVCARFPLCADCLVFGIFVCPSRQSESEASGRRNCLADG